MVSDKYHDNRTVKPVRKAEQGNDREADREQAFFTSRACVVSSINADGALVAFDRFGHGNP